MTSGAARALLPRTILRGGQLARPDHLDLPVLPLCREHLLVADAVDLLAGDLDAEAEGQLTVQRLVVKAAERRHHLGPVEAAGLLDGPGERLERDEPERGPSGVEPLETDLLPQREVRVLVALREVGLVRRPRDAFGDGSPRHRVVLVGDRAVRDVQLLRSKPELEGLLGERGPGGSAAAHPVDPVARIAGLFGSAGTIGMPYLSATVDALIVMGLEAGPVKKSTLSVVASRSYSSTARSGLDPSSYTIILMGS